MKEHHAPKRGPRTRHADRKPVIPRPPFVSVEDKVHFLTWLHTFLLYTLPLDLFLATTPRVVPSGTLAPPRMIADSYDGPSTAAFALVIGLALLGLARPFVVSVALDLASWQERFSSSPLLKVAVGAAVLLSGVEVLFRVKGASLPFVLAVLVVLGASLFRSYKSVSGWIKESAEKLKDNRELMSRLEEAVFGLTAVSLGASRLISILGALSVAGADSEFPYYIPYFLCSLTLLALMAPSKETFRYPCARCRGPGLAPREDITYCPACNRGKGSRRAARRKKPSPSAVKVPLR